MTQAESTRPKHELDSPPWQRVESTLMATSRAIREAYDARFADLNLNLSQASMLVFVHESGPLRQSQLARRLGQGRASTGAMIDQLERRELVERQADPADRRAWLVTITKQGEKLVEPINAIDRVLRSQLRLDISKAERQQLAKLLLRLQSNLARVLAESEAS
jgi:DNA-binding MarR family transcriptional regulator